MWMRAALLVLVVAGIGCSPDHATLVVSGIPAGAKQLEIAVTMGNQDGCITVLSTEPFLDDPGLSNVAEFKAVRVAVLLPEMKSDELQVGVRAVGDWKDGAEVLADCTLAIGSARGAPGELVVPLNGDSDRSLRTASCGKAVAITSVDPVSLTTSESSSMKFHINGWGFHSLTTQVSTFTNKNDNVQLDIDRRESSYAGIVATPETALSAGLRTLQVVSTPLPYCAAGAPLEPTARDASPATAPISVTSSACPTGSQPCTKDVRRSNACTRDPDEKDCGCVNKGMSQTCSAMEYCQRDAGGDGTCQQCTTSTCCGEKKDGCPSGMNCIQQSSTLKWECGCSSDADCKSDMSTCFLPARRCAKQRALHALMWREDGGYYRTIPLDAGGLPDYSNAEAWIGPVVPKGLDPDDSGQWGAIEALSSFVYGNSSKLWLQVWRYKDTNTTKCRSYDISSGVVNWATGNWDMCPSQSDHRSLPNQGEKVHAADATFFRADGVSYFPTPDSMLVKLPSIALGIWQGKQRYYKYVPLINTGMSDTPDWFNATPWLPLTPLRGRFPFISDDTEEDARLVQSQSSFIVRNGGNGPYTYYQSIFWNNIDYLRIYPLSQAFGPQEPWRPLNPFFMSGLPGSGEIKAWTNWVTQ